MAPHREQEARAAAETAARRSYGKLVAFLSHRLRDVAAAEDALSEAFAAALADWPSRGIPQSPEAWLMTVAHRRASDAQRRRQRSEDAADDVRLLADELAALAGEEQIPDQRLGLIFACAHPAIDASIRAPLILQTMLGVDAATIASAFLVAPATMQQRLVRAKTRIKQSGVPLRVPDRGELPERLSGVLDAIYAAYTEGWADPAGTESRRRNLADEAIWLGRLIVELLPEEAEALGLLALMLFAEARRAARRTPEGDYVPLAAQDTRLWDERAIAAAERALHRASRLGAVGRYQLEAAIQSAHVVRRRSGAADWPAIVRLYDALAVLTGSPVVAINRAAAIAEAHGARAGLEALAAVAPDPRIADYQPYWATRAELLSRAGDCAAADHAFRLAIGLESDPAVRRYLQGRQLALGAAAAAVGGGRAERRKG
jgi:RNA polymerase sigma-70 factor, ECF subfamily